MWANDFRERELELLVTSTDSMCLYSYSSRTGGWLGLCALLES